MNAKKIEPAKVSESRRMSRLAPVLFGVLALARSGSMQAADLFNTEQRLPADAGAGLIAGAICSFGALSQPVDLREAIERSLCQNPKTRAAWIGVKQAAAGVGLAKAAYLPTLSGTWQAVRDDSVSDVTNRPSLSSQDREVVRSQSASLNWVLYDFGAREDALASANALFAAASASHLSVLQQAFVDTAKDYYAAQAAAGALEAANEVEATARRSFAVAAARVSGGAAPISDQLQAQTSLAQAVVNRGKAQGDRQISAGTLLSDMNLSPSDPIELPIVDDGIPAAADFEDSIGRLLDAAALTHPAILAAQAQVDAAVSKTRETRDRGSPTISYVAKYSHNNQPASLGLGIPEYPAVGHDFYMGVELSIPIFEGFTRTYQIRQADADTESRRVALLDTRSKVALECWSAYQALKVGTANLGNSATLLDISQHAYDATLRRYQLGVGGILELLAAQGALASAKQQRIQSLTDWRGQRLRLAGSIGRLDADNLVP